MKQLAMRILLIHVLVLFVLLASSSMNAQSTENKGNLRVVVTNMRSQKGQIGFSLYNNKEGFPHPEEALITSFIIVNGNATEFIFTNIEFGTYAVSVFHDENDDKVLNSNFLGIPTEGVGVSNNAKGSFGPPKFNDAKFEFNKSEQTMTISLSYL